jgi:hypothetical protein
VSSNARYYISRSDVNVAFFIVHLDELALGIEFPFFLGADGSNLSGDFFVNKEGVLLLTSHHLHGESTGIKFTLGGSDSNLNILDNGCTISSGSLDSVGPQASFFEIDQATGKLTMKPGNNLSQTGKFKVGIKRTTADGAPIIEYVEITVTPAKCELDTSAFPMEMMTGEKKNPFFVDEEISTKIATVCPKEEWELDTQS